MEQLSGVVERITFSNEQSGFAVVKIKSKGFPDLVTLVGTLATVRVGSTIRVSGEWRMDTKFGRQFAAASFEETVPATLAGLEKYLGSGLIKGIGPKFAKLIVRTFRNDTLQVLDERPEDLHRVPGIGDKRVSMIRKAWLEQQEIKNLMLFLQDHDVSTHYAGKIYKTYGNAAIQTVRENPYRLADDIWGIGFRTADAIAKKLGVDPLSYARCRSGILYVINELSGQGHCYVTRPQLEKACEKLLELPADVIGRSLSQMAIDRDIVVEHPDQPAGLRLTETASEAIADPNALLWLPVFWYAETGVATRLLTLMGTQSPYRDMDPEPVLAQAERESGLTYDPVQREAVRMAVSAKCTVLTGGPGTGKTTTTLAILRAFEAFGANVLLAAPTGRAAKRLAETTGREARTIHRLLEYKPPEGAARNAENPLVCDVLVVDETSMVDILLLYDLLKAVPETAVLLLVGDVDQLPSVGPGNILLDVMASERAAVVRLTRIFRQAEGSAIIRNAHRINRGEMPDLKTVRDADFFFIEREDPHEAALTIQDLCARRLPARYGFNPMTDIQVLCPMQRGETGAAAMNGLLQQALNPSPETVKYAGNVYRLGDKVMQIRNNYDKNVFNGDMGTLAGIDREDGTVTIRFDGLPVPYEMSELDEIMPAYAVTVHKAQGSEYPVVVAPIGTQHYMMLQRNLLYTCVTRAKRLLVLVGSRRALGMAVANNRIRKRNTRLADRIRNGVPAAGGGAST
jgi:exodeoxyribonuclease V alpha subunit